MKFKGCQKAVKLSMLPGVMTPSRLYGNRTGKDNHVDKIVPSLSGEVAENFFDSPDFAFPFEKGETG